jgi:hypothetical protein
MPVENLELSIQVNPFHRLPVRILHQFEYQAATPQRFTQFHPSLIPKFITNLLLASEHIRSTVEWDSKYSEIDDARDWQVLKTRMGKIEFIPIPGDPRELVEIITPKGESLLIAKVEIPTLAFGLLCALKLLQQMHPAVFQLELIYGNMTDKPSSCLPAREAW